MKIRTYVEMIEEYKVRPIDDDDDMAERKVLLGKNEHSIIFEGDFLEFDTAIEWIKAELRIIDLQWLFYGKLGYDYGFFEIFFSRKEEQDKFSAILPQLYTKYPNGSVARSDGYDNIINLQE